MRHNTNIQFTTLTSTISSFTDEVGEDPVFRAEQERDSSTLGYSLDDVRWEVLKVITLVLDIRISPGARTEVSHEGW